MNPFMKVTVAGVDFKNPVIAASGTFGFGKEFSEFYPLSKLGGIATKGLTLEKRDGNPTPRIAETPSGMLNAVGLQNPGFDAFFNDDLPFLKKSGTTIVANIAGKTIEEYAQLAEKLDGWVEMIELNISCPNVKEGGVAFGIYPESVGKVTRAVKDRLNVTPLTVKLSPNVASISDNAKAAEANGADAVSLINTLTGMAIDIKKRRPILQNVTGGLSGAAVKPVALRMVYEVYKAVKIPIIGMGGIMSAEDIVEFMLAGATAVEVGTANFTSVNAMPRMIEGLKEYLIKNNIADVRELTGGLMV